MKKSRAISAVAAAVLALSGFPAAAAAAEAALDPVVVDRSVSANGRPITLPAGASEVVVKLPADAVAVLGEKGITSLSYDFYNGNSSPLPGLSGTASISSDDQTVTVPFPADFSGFSPGDLIYCEDTFNLCHNTVTHPYRGFQLVLAGHGPSGTPHIPFYGRAGLSPGTAAGPSPVTVDLGRGWVATYGTFYALQRQPPAALKEVSDKLVLRAQEPLFHYGPLGNWHSVGTSSSFLANLGTTSARGNSFRSGDGRIAVVTPASSDVLALCGGEAFDLNLRLDGWAEPGMGRGSALMEMSVGTPACTQTFGDVSLSNQFYKEIQWLANQKISTGYDGGLFQPLEPVRRDAMAAFLYRLAGQPAFDPPAVSPFADIRPGDQFYKEVTWLAAKKISQGWDEGDGTRTFRPLTPVNRDAMAAFLYRFSGEPGIIRYPPLSFSDVEDDHPFYDAIYWLTRNSGVSDGYPDMTFRPLQTVNRDAMAAFLYRMDTLLLTQNVPTWQEYRPLA